MLSARKGDVRGVVRILLGTDIGLSLEVGNLPESLQALRQHGEHTGVVRASNGPGYLAKGWKHNR
jgi:hypothetical protein